MCCGNKDSNGPSISGVSKSIGRAVGDVIRQDFVTTEVEVKRLSVCMTCPHRVNKLFPKKEDKIQKTDICALCLCRLKGWIGILPPKAKLKNSVCDSGRWES